jgi:tRNA pseudouridine55 synthase
VIPAQGAVLNIDKPVGITSFDVVRSLKRVFGKMKIGHAGTLDLPASGVLLVCVGQATRAIGLFQELPKTYQATIRLGTVTDTDDMSGVVLRTAVVDGARVAERLPEVLRSFHGTILQKPPVFSALKLEGRRAADLARRGQTIALAARPVTIHGIELLSVSGDTVDVLVRCSKGTYIRALARDIGEALGCGATIERLHRSAIGMFTDQASLPGCELSPDMVMAALVPLDQALSFLPAIQLDEQAAGGLAFGRRPGNCPLPEDGSAVRLVDRTGGLLALARMGSVHYLEFIAVFCGG